MDWVCVHSYRPRGKMDYFMRLGDKLLFMAYSDFHTMQVSRILVEKCTTYSDCLSCTRSGEPLCGWCSLEKKCSRISFCQSGHLQGRWVQEMDRCISSVVLSAESLAVDNLRIVSLDIKT